MNKIIIGIIILVIIGGAWLLMGNKEVNKVQNKEVKTSVKTVEELPKNLAFMALGTANQVALIDRDKKEIFRKFDASNNPHGVAVANGYIFTSSTKMGPKEMAMVPKDESEKKKGEDMTGEMKDMEKDAAAGNPHHPQKEGAVVGSNIIAVISQKTGKIIKEINVGGGSHHLAVSPDGTKVGVIIPSQNGVAIIDTNKLEKISFMETGKVSNYGVFSADSKSLFVSNSVANTISIINLENGEVSNVKVGKLPDHIVLGKNNKFIYTADATDGAVSVVDIVSKKVVGKIPVGKVPHGIAISNDGKKVFVANSKSETVSVIDVAMNKVIKNIKFDGEIAHLEVAPNSNELWVNSEEEKKTYILSTEDYRVLSEIEIKAEPHQISF